MNKNPNFNQLPDRYLFKEIVLRSQEYSRQHPSHRLLHLGIGDVSFPLSKPIIEAMHKAVDEMGGAETFRGYGPEEGYRWLRQAIIANDFNPRGIDLELDEVFVSDGAGSDLGNLNELFLPNNRVAICDPSYPAYVDSSIMAGREVLQLPCTPQNKFIPELPRERADIIFLCFPNNPTGVVLTRQQLQQWVDYAIKQKSIIIFDAAYECFIEDSDVPHSIYELKGAKQVAIEVHSFSKSAGFTGLRCGYTIVPKETGLQAMWLRRQSTKYNGTSYITQRAAMATFSPEGRKALNENICYYRETARMLYDGLKTLDFEVYGGKNSPYLWCRTPKGMKSWEFFDLLLAECQIVCTPGVGFGEGGEGFVRFSAFSKREDCKEAIKRIQKKKIEK